MIHRLSLPAWQDQLRRDREAGVYDPHGREPGLDMYRRDITDEIAGDLPRARTREDLEDEAA